MSIRDTITQRRLLTKDQLELMLRPVYSFKLTNKQVSYNRSRTGHVLFMFLHDQASKKTVLVTLAYIGAAVNNSLSFQTNMYRVSCIDLELVIILAFLGKDTLKRCIVRIEFSPLVQKSASKGHY